MPEAVSCSCGYRGPAIEVAGRATCPICRTPAATAAVAPASPRPPTVRSVDQPPDSQRSSAAKPPRLRVPCPRGHMLKLGPHLFGQQLVCPECNEMFVPREDDSLERRKELEKARLAEEEQLAKRWLQRSIWAAAFIVASLAGMIAFSFAMRPPSPSPAEPPSAPDPAARSE